LLEQFHAVPVFHYPELLAFFGILAAFLLIWLETKTTADRAAGKFRADPRS